ncbi:hypothetical protein ABZP36_007341 [Zizania latifolia]
MLTLVGTREPFVKVQACLSPTMQSKFPTRTKLPSGVMTQKEGAGGKGVCWEVLGSLEQQNRVLPPMPCLTKAGFGVVVLDGKLFVMAGYVVAHGKECVSDEVYQYDAHLNRRAALAKMNVARRDFACTEVNGAIYIAGGFGCDGDGLSSVEVYDPQENKWALIERLCRPRWGSFASSFNGKLYIMGGRLFCIEWKNQRSLVILNPSDNSWQKILVSLTGSSSTQLSLGVLDRKLLLFSQQEESGYQTLMYNPIALAGSECELNNGCTRTLGFADTRFPFDAQC